MVIMKYTKNPVCKMKIEYDLNQINFTTKKRYIPLDRRCKLKEYEPKYYILAFS